jgi:hypothetical protein
MPPRKRISAPANRIYKSSTPLQQTKLPAARKRIKSYGKKSSVRVPKQETLTQIDFVKMQFPHDYDEEDEDYEEETKKRKKKRRKTTGDKPSTTPQFHTQTITQLDWSFSIAPEEEDRSIFDVPSSSQSGKVSKNTKKRRARGVPAIEPPPEKSLVRDMPPPQTPHRTTAREIPSSQSPATPLSLHSRDSTATRSPLKEMSVNTPISFNTNSKPQGSPLKPQDLEVEEASDSGTHASQLSRIPSTPSKRSSPAKGVRFALPQVEEEEEAISPSIKLESIPYPTSQGSGGKPLRIEILDSDAESEEGEEDEEAPASTGQMVEEEDLDDKTEEAMGLQVATAQDDEDQQAETESCYGEIGAETQMEAERILDSPQLSGIAPTTRTNESSAAEKFQERTQMMESQRLATQYIDMMAPRTADSDIFISIHPKHVTNIINRAKDHETRPWSFPPKVCRVWIYETKPVSALRYMAEIGPPKRPGEILDERGLGNAEFNAKKGPSWIAYEILQLYELSDHLSLSQLVANEWLEQAPNKYKWVRPAVVDQLMANLKAPLFHTAESDVLASSSTDTQEAGAQLLSTIKQFTQPAHSSQLLSSQFIKSENENHDPTPSDYYATPQANIKTAPPASQATTVDLSQTQTPRHQSLVEVVWESPTRPVPSSTPLKLPTPFSASSQYRGPDSLVPYSMASSQLLTESQLLPESVLNESVPGPPLFIQDSDDDEEL